MILVHESDLPDPGAVGRARRALRDALSAAGVDLAHAQLAVLVASELVTNAVRHARTAFTLSVEVLDGAVRIEVFDRDTRQPLVLGPDSGSTGGRGMQIVADVAEQWGVQTEVRDGIDGKAVWAVVPLERPA